jgi:hypothetical protein
MRWGWPASSVGGMSVTADRHVRARLPLREPDANDPGLLTSAQASLLTDQYEVAMAASYLLRGMNEVAVFELLVRRLPARRRWLMAAGLGPALALVRDMQFGAEELAYVGSLGFDDSFLQYFSTLRGFGSPAMSTRYPRARSCSRASRWSG